MKMFSSFLMPSVVAITIAGAQEVTWTNFYIQKHLPDGPSMQIDNIAPTDSEFSPMPIARDGSRFELHTIRSAPFDSFLLQSTYVGTYIPQATVAIDTEDPWGKEPNTETYTNVSYLNPDFETTRIMPVNTPAKIRRTRVDRPFKVYVLTKKYNYGDPYPAAAGAVNFYHHTQSYGEDGIGDLIDRSQAIESTPAYPQFVAPDILCYPQRTSPSQDVGYYSTIAGANRLKIRGEERFSVFSLEDATIPNQVIAPNELSSNTLQVWPMSDGSISGIAMNEKINFKMPQVTFTYNDTYPGSHTFAQIYKGDVQDNVDGIIVPGSSKNNTEDYPDDYLESTGGEFDRMFDSDGRWTMEILTISPFDTIRLGYVSFDLDRTMEVNSTVTTIE